MAISKIVYHTDASDTTGTTWMDVTPDTVTSSKLLSGETATDASGTQVTGNIATKTSSNMTVSGATVTAPAGYYASNASKSVSSGSATTPATTVTANPTISVNSSTGLITATTSATKSVTPTVSAGYVSSGTAGTITVSGSKTSQLSTQAATTITPTTSSQTAVAAGKYTTGAVTVGAIPSQYIVPSGTKSITENGTGIDVASYASVDVDVSGGGGGVTYGEFTVTKNSSITTYSSYIGFIDYVLYYVQSVPVRIPLPRKLANGTTTYYGHGIVDSDGYMYIAFLGNSDSYWPSVTATSGTATQVTTASSNGYFNNDTTYPHFNAIVWYKLTPDAVVTMSYYNNN